MSAGARVVWSEGMFLRTQHFQQQDRWVGQLVRESVRQLRGHAWGFRSLEINTGLLTQGKFAVSRCDGILPDGTPFAIPEGGPHPEPLPAGPESLGALVHLALPVQQEGAVEIDPVDAPASSARFQAREVEIRDSVAGVEARAPIHIAEPRFKLMLDRANRSAYTTMAVARIGAVQPDGSIMLDPSFIPPCLSIRPSGLLLSFLDELSGKLASIGKERAAFVAGKRLGGSGDIADFLILQLCNRVEPVVRSLAEQANIHPEDLHCLLLSLAGEASTFAGGELRPVEMPPYVHEQPHAAYGPLMAELRRVLLELSRPDRKAMQIPLKLFPSGVRAAEVPDPGLFTSATFIIAFNAPISPETIRVRLPGQIKIGPAEELQQIVRAAVPGVPIRHLPTVPREIPLHRGMVYFELDRNNDYWRRLPNSAGLAFHVTGDLREGMDMECWAIRD